MELVSVGSYEPVPRTLKSLGWPNKTNSQGDPTPRASNSTSIPGMRPTKTLLPRIYTIQTGTRHRYNSQGALRSHSGKTCSSAHRRILSSRLDPHHTPKTHAKISLVITILMAPSALATHTQTSTKHHITDIMHSREQVASNKWASIQIVGV
jgi:hypothetical protein